MGQSVSGDVTNSSTVPWSIVGIGNGDDLCPQVISQSWPRRIRCKSRCRTQWSAWRLGELRPGGPALGNTMKYPEAMAVFIYSWWEDVEKNTSVDGHVFPECVARVPVSLWGSGDWAMFARCCPTVRNRSQSVATVRNRSQPFATVRNRPRKGHMAVPMVSSAKGAFQRRVASLRVAGVALRDIPTCFMSTCQKRFCAAGAKLLRRFQKMRCIFRGRRSTMETSDVILRGRRNTFDLSCRESFANRIVRAARSGDKAQIPWQAWNFVTCDENRWNVDFVVGSWENS